MSTTRLCIVLGSHWEAQMGGAQYQAKCLLDALASHTDFETYYLAQVVPEGRERPGYEIVQFGPRRMEGMSGTLLSLPSLYRRLRMLQPDVVYQRCLLPYTGLCAWYCVRNGIPFVFHIASDDDVRRQASKGSRLSLLRRIARRISEYGLQNAKFIVAQTQAQAQMLKREYGLDAAAVVPNFQPLPVDPAPARDARRLRVIWVGNFKPVKRAELFVALAEALAGDADIELVMIGRPGDSERYETLHRRIERLPRLCYLGELPLERVNREIAASDVLVCTSSYEGFPNTFIQAWLRSVPVLSNAVDPDGCLRKGGAGLLVEQGEGDVSGLARTLRELHADRAKLTALARRAHAYGLANHLPEKAERLVELLKPAAAAAGRS